MNWRQAYDLLKAAVEAEATVAANSLPVLDGVHANMEIEELAKVYEGQFSDHAFTVVIEHPAAAVFQDTGQMAFLRNAFTIMIVENPTFREEAGALDPLVVPYNIATGVIGQPGYHGGNNFEANEDFYKYQGDKKGLLFHRFTFLITTHLPAVGLPAGPAPVAL